MQQKTDIQSQSASESTLFFTAKIHRLRGLDANDE